MNAGANGGNAAGEQPPGACPCYAAHFTPEAWVNNQAVEVDPDGPQEWDCTAYAREHQDYLASLRDRTGTPDSTDEVTDNDDVFKGDPAAPQWVRDWRGPFTIRITRQRPADPPRTWNVLAAVIALVPAGSAAEAIGTLRAQLTAAGFDVYEGEPGCSAFESEDT